MPMPVCKIITLGINLMILLLYVHLVNGRWTSGGRRQWLRLFTDQRSSWSAGCLGGAQRRRTGLSLVVVLQRKCCGRRGSNWAVYNVCVQESSPAAATRCRSPNAISASWSNTRCQFLIINAPEDQPLWPTEGAPSEAASVLGSGCKPDRPAVPTTRIDCTGSTPSKWRHIGVTSSASATVRDFRKWPVVRKSDRNGRRRQQYTRLLPEITRCGNSDVIATACCRRRKSRERVTSHNTSSPTHTPDGHMHVVRVLFHVYNVAELAWGSWDFIEFQKVKLKSTLETCCSQCCLFQGC